MATPPSPRRYWLKHCLHVSAIQDPDLRLQFTLVISRYPRAPTPSGMGSVTRPLNRMRVASETSSSLGHGAQPSFFFLILQPIVPPHRIAHNFLTTDASPVQIFLEHLGLSPPVIIEHIHHDLACTNRPDRPASSVEFSSKQNGASCDRPYENASPGFQPLGRSCHEGTCVATIWPT